MQAQKKFKERKIDMVTRPFFVPRFDKVGVDVKTSAPFAWNPGFAVSQKKKNVHALHDAIRFDVCPQSRPLEVSSKSDDEVGVSLSAFNLTLTMDGQACTVESVFQASKVFEGGIGPFHELYAAPSGEVHAKVKALRGTPLVAFDENGVVWPLNPTRAFYDWIYCLALHEHKDLVAKLSGYDSFTDIEFNPKRSLNCQAYAVALYLSMSAAGVLEEALSGKDAFLRCHPQEAVQVW